MVALAVEDLPVVTVTLIDASKAAVSTTCAARLGASELQFRILAMHMENGVRILDPATA
ncbi:MAG: hypothetical protein R3E96_03305 [Planctomycetota bacterium]